MSAGEKLRSDSTTVKLTPYLRELIEKIGARVYRTDKTITVECPDYIDDRTASIIGNQLAGSNKGDTIEVRKGRQVFKY